MSMPSGEYKPVSRKTLEDLLPAPKPAKKKRNKDPQHAAAKAIREDEAAQLVSKAHLTDKEVKLADQRRKSVKSLGYYLLSGVELAHANRVRDHLSVEDNGVRFLADAVEWGIRHAVRAADQGDDVFPVGEVLTRGQEILDAISPTADTPVPLDTILSDSARVWLGMVK